MDIPKEKKKSIFFHPYKLNINLSDEVISKAAKPIEKMLSFS